MTDPFSALVSRTFWLHVDRGALYSSIADITTAPSISSSSILCEGALRSATWARSGPHEDQLGQSGKASRRFSIHSGVTPDRVASSECPWQGTKGRGPIPTTG